MSFYDWDEEHLSVVRGSIEKFCQEELTPETVRWMDENCDFPPDDLWKKLAEHGIFDRSLASSPYEFLIIQEEIATASVAVMLAIGASIGFGQGFIAMLGTPEQREEFLPKLAAGQVKMCMALTEPGGGTDILGSLRSTAVEDGNDYVLNGQKVFITAAHVADYLIVIAITDPKAEDKSQSWSVFLVDAKSPGVTIRKIPKLGIHACACCEIFLENVRVPKENLIGPKNGAYRFLVGGGGSGKSSKAVGGPAKGDPRMNALLNIERVSSDKFLVCHAVSLCTESSFFRYGRISKQFGPGNCFTGLSLWEGLFDGIRSCLRLQPRQFLVLELDQTLHVDDLLFQHSQATGHILSLAPLFFHGLVSHQQFILQFLQLGFIRCTARGCSTFRGIRGNQLETGFCDRYRYLGGTLRLCRLQQATRLAPRRVLCPGFT